MKVKPNVTELLAKAQKPSDESLRLHPFYRGKLEVTPKCRIKSSAGRKRKLKTLMEHGVIADVD